MAMALSSCYQSVLDPLSGIFPSPTVVNDYASAAATSVKGEQGRLIDLDLTGSTTVHIAFVGNKYYLTENTYTEAQAMAAKNGNFIIGQTKVNGVSVKSGRVEVERAAVDTEKKDYSLDDVYTIKYVLFCEDGTPYKGTWSGKLAFHPDPVLGDIIIENVLADATSHTEAGMVKHLMNLTDGDGNPAGCFEIFVDPGAATITGTYVCKEYAENLGEGGIIANGYNFPDWGISGGSYYMKDGARVDVNAGQTVVIAPLSDKSYIFSIDGTEFVAAGTELGEGIVFEYAGVDADSLTEAGKEKHMVYATLDDAVAACFELFVEPNADINGTYTCKEYAENLGESLIFANGYNFPDWGIAGGSYYMKDGVRVDIGAGELLTVAKAGAKLYVFSGSTGYSFLVKF
jgi:hypothetical protein